MKLINAIRETPVGEGELAICWLGQAGFCLKDAAGRMLMVDPYLTNCGQRMRGFKRLSACLIDPAEVVPQYYIATHIHFDHFDYDAIPVVAHNSPQTLFLGPGSCIKEFEKAGVQEERCCRLDQGSIFNDRAVTIQAIWADHGTMAPDAIGVLLEMGGHRLYFSGDTAFHEDLFQSVARFRPEVAFLSVNGQFGNMNAAEGARAAMLCGAKYTVPCHIWTFIEHQGNLYDFCRDVKKAKNCIPCCFAQGEIQILDQEGKLIESEEERKVYESYPLYAARSHRVL